MKTIIRAQGMDLTPALKQHAEQKLEQAIAKLVAGEAVRLTVELRLSSNARDNVDKECHVTCSMPSMKPVNITEVSDDMYKAIDLAEDRLVRQVKRLRGRSGDLQRRAERPQPAS